MFSSSFLVSPSIDGYLSKSVFTVSYVFRVFRSAGKAVCVTYGNQVSCPRCFSFFGLFRFSVVLQNRRCVIHLETGSCPHCFCLFVVLAPLLIFRCIPG